MPAGIVYEQSRVSAVMKEVRYSIEKLLRIHRFLIHFHSFEAVLSRDTGNKMDRRGVLLRRWVLEFLV